MDKLEPIQYLLAGLLKQSSQAPYCFEKCIKK
jgi:hypothetical protein